MTNRHDLAPHDRWQADLPGRAAPAEEATPPEPWLPDEHPADPDPEAESRAFVDNLVKFD